MGHFLRTQIGNVETIPMPGNFGIHKSLSDRHGNIAFTEAKRCGHRDILMHLSRVGATDVLETS
jgi:hypothetical protein